MKKITIISRYTISIYVTVLFMFAVVDALYCIMPEYIVNIAILSLFSLLFIWVWCEILLEVSKNKKD